MPSLYCAYFQLEETPFSIAPDPRFVFLSERHREALGHLLFGLSLALIHQGLVEQRFPQLLNPLKNILNPLEVFVPAFFMVRIQFHRLLDRK